jgi:hypothetical protein
MVHERTKPNTDTIHALSALSHTCPRTVKRAFERGIDAIRTPAVRHAIEQAAAELGVELPKGAQP